MTSITNISYTHIILSAPHAHLDYLVFGYESTLFHSIVYVFRELELDRNITIATAIAATIVLYVFTFGCPS